MAAAWRLRGGCVVAAWCLRASLHYFDTCQLERRWLLIILAFRIQMIVPRALIRAIVSVKQSFPTALPSDCAPSAARAWLSMTCRV